MAAPSLPCANCRPDGTDCQNIGKSTCANYRLVAVSFPPPVLLRLLCIMVTFCSTAAPHARKPTGSSINSTASHRITRRRGCLSGLWSVEHLLSSAMGSLPRLVVNSTRMGTFLHSMFFASVRMKEKRMQARCACCSPVCNTLTLRAQ